MEVYPGRSLHGIGPYQGRVEPRIARELLSEYTAPGDTVWDPFCGSGTIPLEARLLSRDVVAADVNPYARALTLAKLHAPMVAETSFREIAAAAKLLTRRTARSLPKAPQWVREFFHPRTLAETRILMGEFLRRGQHFNVGCLLGILHHQRRGFLSYPASHMAPYLRTKRFPRDRYPEEYEYRDPICRLEAKVGRMLKHPPPCLTSRFVVARDSVISTPLSPSSVDAVVTSPPYMDDLDYARDSRLRLWFLGVEDYHAVEARELRGLRGFRESMLATLVAMASALKPGAPCILILGDSVRRGTRRDVPQLVADTAAADVGELRFEDSWEEVVATSRRSTTASRSLRTETFLVFRRI